MIIFKARETCDVWVILGWFGWCVVIFFFLNLSNMRRLHIYDVIFITIKKECVDKQSLKRLHD